ncbi:DUF2254 domain-containing protein [Blastococcus sp. TF02-09]|uniref:DUF2254 domain-containing protein n=1 Tax=Blastococcus sp. TF02-09 TaxID=2250576 RepID=UPI000DE97405|nr:DUF2254 domain-containing protein [Blastococcus sp. TF02-9]RBY78497.1 DUF2254 domain-containing protein [Blastococcus sp. TF02-9]
MSPRTRGPAAAVLARLRSALWPIPVLGVVIAIGLGIGMPALDSALEGGNGEHPLTFAFGGGPSAARDLLAAIAGSLISVTGLTFSLTIVALQLGSSQYSPRLLQTFVTDRVVQLTLAQLVATFVYALTVLRTVRTEDAAVGSDAVVPRLSITVGYLMTLGSVVALLLFLGHLARSLRVETMLRDVHDEASRTIDRELPGAGSPPEPPPEVPVGAGRPVVAASSGFLVDVDEAALVAAARRYGVLVRLAVRIGDSVVAGTPVAHVWPLPEQGAADLDEVAGALADGLRLGFERSPERDVAYSLRKVVDIAARALSPGINDPTTAVHALSHASAILGDLVERPLTAVAHSHDDGVVRLVVPQWTAAALLELVVEEPLQFADGQPAVLRRLAALLREVAWRAPRGLLDDALHRHLSDLTALAGETTRVPPAELSAWETRLDRALAGLWPSDGPGAGGV